MLRLASNAYSPAGAAVFVEISFILIACDYCRRIFLRLWQKCNPKHTCKRKFSIFPRGSVFCEKTKRFAYKSCPKATLRTLALLNFRHFNHKIAQFFSLRFSGIVLTAQFPSSII